MKVPESGRVSLELHVNGETHEVSVWPLARLIDVLRQDLRLTGTKEGCGEGECGACSVFIDGTLVNSCLVPAIQAQGCQIETIESLASEDQLSPLQEAFLVGGGAQCGICTPGMVLAAASLLRTNPSPDESEIRQALAGNLCRCTGYTRIVQSVVDACERIGREESK